MEIMAAKQVIERKLRALSRYFIPIETLNQLGRVMYDAIPTSFSYDRLNRSITLVLAIELERLLKIQDYFREAIYILCEVKVRLPGHGSIRNIAFSESFSFTCGESSGDGVVVRKIEKNSSFVKSAERRGLYIPRQGYSVYMKGIDFLFFVERRGDLNVRLLKEKKGAPQFLISGNRRIKVTKLSKKLHPYHGASVVQVKIKSK